MTTIFEVTVPENTFAPGAARYVVGLVKTAAHYEFSQRRTDIASLIQGERAQMRADVVKNLQLTTI